MKSTQTCDKSILLGQIASQISDIGTHVSGYKSPFVDSDPIAVCWYIKESN